MTTVEIRPVRLPVEALTPQVNTEVFGPQPDAHFWLGVTGVGNEPLMPSERIASGVLRANVYVDENGFLPVAARQADGTETDIDDGRSIHFAIVEHDLSVGGLTRVVGNTRFIRKRDADDILPVERLFPEAFSSEAAPVNASEASRFIARHPNKLTQSALSLSLIRAMTMYATSESSRPVYAIVEGHLAKLFAKIGLPFEQIADMKMLPEYNTPNMAIRFEPDQILCDARASRDGQEILKLFFNEASIASAGVGYFDETMITPLAPVNSNRQAA